MRRILDQLARRGVVEWSVLVLAIALPCRYLLATGSDYYLDWSNHQWTISYTAEFFRHHGTMPAVLNTSEGGGLAIPVFYGNLFYPMLAFAARWSSPSLAIRIAVVVLYAAQFRLVSKALIRIGAPRGLGHGVACLVVWAIYPLTNLYNRGALTELFATGLLVCALALLVLVCRAVDARQRRRTASAMMLALTLAAGSHPITALVGVPMFAVLGGVFWWLLRADRAGDPAERGLRAAGAAAVVPASREPDAPIAPPDDGPRSAGATAVAPASREPDARPADGPHPASAPIAVPPLRPSASHVAASIAPWLGLAALCLAPWLYATAAYAAHLKIRHFVPGVVFFPEAMDAWSTRFSPLPLDVRVVPGVALGTVSTPYLDAQVNVALLIVFAMLAVIAIRAARGGRARRPLAIALAASVGLFAAFTAMSLVPATYRALPAVMATIQFAYRAITYQNLALLAGVFLLVIAVPGLGQRLGHPGVRAVMAACLALSAAGVVVKWRHIAAVQHDRVPLDPIHLPAQYYGAADYSTEDLFTPLGAEPVVARSFVFDPGRRFGLASTLIVDGAGPTWIATNIQSFPWNAISIDGVRVTASELRTANGALVVRVPAGTHRLRVRLAAPALWRVLRIASLLGLGGWWLGMLVELALAKIRRARSAP